MITFVITFCSLIWSILGLMCPPRSTQIGGLNADIAGCGLEGCDARYEDSYPTARACVEGCESRSDCLSFSWAPMGGDMNHVDHSVCTLYDSTATTGDFGPEQVLCEATPLSCPFPTEQVGAINADIPGCGLEGCDARYQDDGVYVNMRDCSKGCSQRADCRSFTWAPMNGDQNHPGKSVCTLYDSIVSTGSFGPHQIMCKMPPPRCPPVTIQIGGLNADIPGCGLEGCDPRYEYANMGECAQGCSNNPACLSFSWAPINGDQNHPGETVCTLYDSDTSTDVFGPEQILCSRPSLAPGASDMFGYIVDENGNTSSMMMYMMYLVALLLCVNIVCMTISWCKRDNVTKYKRVSIQSDTDC